MFCLNHSGLKSALQKTIRQNNVDGVLDRYFKGLPWLSLAI